MNLTPWLMMERPNFCFSWNNLSETCKMTNMGFQSGVKNFSWPQSQRRSWDMTLSNGWWTDSTLKTHVSVDWNILSENLKTESLLFGCRRIPIQGTKLFDRFIWRVHATRNSHRQYGLWPNIIRFSSSYNLPLLPVLYASRVSHLSFFSAVEAVHLANLLCQFGYYFPVNELKNLMVKDDSSLYRFQVSKTTIEIKSVHNNRMYDLFCKQKVFRKLWVQKCLRN